MTGTVMPRKGTDSPSHADRWAFTENQVMALTGLSAAQLRYWRQTGFFQPTYDNTIRFYSFRDLVGLRTIATLRNSGVSLQELRKVGRWLHEYHETPWASLRFWLLGKQVFVVVPGSDVPVTHSPTNQLGFPVLMQDMAAGAEHAVVEMRQRQRSSIGRIKESRGRAFVDGTRITTARLYEFAEDGSSVDEIVAQYPELTVDDVKAALAYERKRRRAA